MECHAAKLPVEARLNPRSGSWALKFCQEMQVTREEDVFWDRWGCTLGILAHLLRLVMRFRGDWTSQSSFENMTVGVLGARCFLLAPWLWRKQTLWKTERLNKLQNQLFEKDSSFPEPSFFGFRKACWYWWWCRNPANHLGYITLPKLEYSPGN